MAQRRLRFAAIGLNHGHIFQQTRTLLDAGGELVAAWAPEPELLDAYLKRFPQARAARCADEILHDESIRMVITAAIPCDRAPLAVTAMRHGKDVMSDKPGATTLAQLDELRRVQAETGRIFSVFFSERFDNPATVRAFELIHGGAIGRPVHMIGLGPHLIAIDRRAPWFFEKGKYGGILVDIASHQVDQFLYLARAEDAVIVASQAANVAHPQYPGLEDFGDMVLNANGVSGYIRVDWFTPEKLGVFGDCRLLVVGTEGYLEVRKYIDLAGRPGGNHLFLVDANGPRHIECPDLGCKYGQLLTDDVFDRTETTMSQAHVFTVCRLALEAEANARK